MKSMNGISPFNYRKLTPNQEKRGEKVCTVILIATCLFGSLAYAIYIPFKPHATDLDALTGGACILAAVVSLRELWRELWRLINGKSQLP
jgi:hypothetical protein